MYVLSIKEFLGVCVDKTCQFELVKRNSFFSFKILAIEIFSLILKFYERLPQNDQKRSPLGSSAVLGNQVQFICQEFPCVVRA